MISTRIGKKVSRVFDLQSIFSLSLDDFDGRNACGVQLIHNFYREVVLTSWDRGFLLFLSSFKTDNRQKNFHRYALLEQLLGGIWKLTVHTPCHWRTHSPIALLVVSGGRGLLAGQ